MDNRIRSILIVLMVCLHGCTQPGPPVAPGRIIASGTVTLDGQPLGWGEIIFFHRDPDIDPLDSEFATAISRGTFEVEIVPGTYRVEIRQWESESSEASDGTPGSAIQRLPKRYNDDSELNATVDDENMKLRFDLVSSPAKS
ncbi:MAG TPA: hypothetical protein VNQ76_04515 [Planctomicrobium sp.]|nr:hypothetical protein [Planctomicrobium sp.]